MLHGVPSTDNNCQLAATALSHRIVVAGDLNLTKQKINKQLLKGSHKTTQDFSYDRCQKNSSVNLKLDENEASSFHDHILMANVFGKKYQLPTTVTI